DVDLGHGDGPGVREAALGDAADQRRAAALEDRQGLPAGAGELPLVAAASRLALAAAKAAALAIGPLVFVNALVNFVEAHFLEAKAKESMKQVSVFSLWILGLSS